MDELTMQQLDDLITELVRFMHETAWQNQVLRELLVERGIATEEEITARYEATKAADLSGVEAHFRSRALDALLAKRKLQ